MKNFIIVLSVLALSTLSYSANRLNYIDPMPEANYVSTGNNIVIGFDKKINLKETEIINSISVTGSKSLQHKEAVTICEGKKKFIFNPSVPFQEGEKITVKLNGKLLQLLNAGSKEYSYWFNTSPHKASTDSFIKTGNNSGSGANFTQSNRVLDPPPQLTVTVNNNPAEGYLFLAPFSTSSYLIITNNNGSIFWFSNPTWWSGDFKKQPNGHLTYWDGNVAKHFEMDENYNIVDTFYCGNGYSADIHELRVLNNRHAFLMAYDTQTVDMSHIVQGGNPNASVIGLIIQEIDENNNVVFQWRSWDHIPITDALHENLLAPVIDYVHGNALEIDNDSNILLSSRHLDEITKINRTTGDIIWRLGGLENQFTFVNDTLGFNYQHAVRRISNGNITIFDNGNWHNPHFSRAVEYSIDEINKTATLVWEYRHNPSIFSGFMGYVQRLDNGNTLISWGGANPTVTEVTPDGTVVFEATYPAGVYTYRAYKFDWNNPVAVHQGNGKIPSAFELKQNFPNPFNPTTVINYSVPKASYVELAVFDITGKEIKKIISGNLQPGNYRASFDGSQYSSGIYFYRLSADNFSFTRKMILIK
jgi:hypothetical protein